MQTNNLPSFENVVKKINGVGAAAVFRRVLTRQRVQN